MRHKLIIIICLLISGALGLGVSLFMHKPLPMVPSDQRLATYHYPPIFLQQIAHDPDAGNKIFHEYCTSCHGNPPIIAVKAPNLSDANICQVLHQKSLQDLQNIILAGKGAMPSRGGCFECNDQQLFATLNYFIHESCQQ